MSSSYTEFKKEILGDPEVKAAYDELQPEYDIIQASMAVLSLEEIKDVIRELLRKYHAEYALLFGSYARGEATPESDIDVVIFGGDHFIPRNVFALAEDLRERTKREADVFEMREINEGTPFYQALLKEGIRIA